MNPCLHICWLPVLFISYFLLESLLLMLSGVIIMSKTINMNMQKFLSVLGLLFVHFTGIDV